MAMSLALAVTAGAAFNDQDKIVNDEAVDMCVALNVINGRTDGSFDPAGNVTRAEMAKMICMTVSKLACPLKRLTIWPIPNVTAETMIATIVLSFESIALKRNPLKIAIMLTYF